MTKAEKQRMTRLEDRCERLMKANIAWEKMYSDLQRRAQQMSNRLEAIASIPVLRELHSVLEHAIQGAYGGDK